MYAKYIFIFLLTLAIISMSCQLTSELSTEPPTSTLGFRETKTMEAKAQLTFDAQATTDAKQTADMASTTNAEATLEAIQSATVEVRDTQLSYMAATNDAAKLKQTEEQALKLPNSTQIQDTPKLEVEMVLVPAGEFMMGSMNGNSDEILKVVYIDDFYIDLTEVTNIMYTICVHEGGCQPPFMNGSFSREDYYGNPLYDDYPVIYVNWDQATAYCEWRGTRLPTEAEWEKAALGTERRTYPWGEEIDCTKANFNLCVGDTSQVGSYPDGHSPYGLQDMAGNVAEWVADWYSDYYYSISPYENPQGPDSGEYRVVRGGSWNSDIWYLRGSSRRTGNFPTFTRHFLGFRCARSP